MYRIGFTSMIGLENWGWILEFTPAFFGAGMLSGINASWSFRAVFLQSFPVYLLADQFCSRRFCACIRH